MAYPISSAALNLFLRQYRQVADITMQTANETIHLTENDIIQGGLLIDRYSMSGNKIEIGSAIAGEISVKLDNKDGRFNDITFEGAELFVRIGVKKWDAGQWENAVINYIPIGYFTVDEPPRKLTSISLNALDRMVSFDKDFDRENITFPATVGELILYCCTKCSVPLQTEVNTLSNYDYSVTACPDVDNLTYRQILQWCGQITGTCLYIDYDGKLRLEWYSDTSSITLDKTLRYTSDLYENAITITGVKITDKEKNSYLAGTEDYAFNFIGNELIQHDYLSVIQSVYATVGGFTYLPYTCTTKALPHLYPLDKITYTDSHGTEHDSIITHWTFTLNGNTELAAKGETATKKGYATVNPLTAREAEILSKMKKANEIELTARQQEALAMNEVVANSLGLFRTAVDQDNGSTIYYYHNAETLADSSVIYTFREGGFAWTNDWNNGAPVWQNGMDRDGNAVLKALSTYKITADYLEAGSVTAEKLSIDYKNSVDNAIESKASQEALETLDGTVSGHTTLIQQNADSILLKASQEDLNTLDGRVSTTESSLTVANDRIAMVVDANGIKAASIVTAVNNTGSTIKISADHIDINGAITLGSLATQSDIPTKVSELTNDSGFKNQAGVVSIINGTVTANYVNALGITANSLVVKNANNQTLLSAGGNAVQIAGWNVDKNSFYSGSSFTNSNAFICSTGSINSLTIAEHTGTGWVFKAGDNFGVDTDGHLFCEGGTFIGEVKALSGEIGNKDRHFKIGVETMFDSTAYIYSGTKYNDPGLNPVLAKNGSLFTKIDELYIGQDGISLENKAKSTTVFGPGCILFYGDFLEQEGDTDRNNQGVLVSHFGISFLNTGEDNVGTNTGQANRDSVYANITHTQNGHTAILGGSWQTSNGVAVTSDRNAKNTIEDIDGRYIDLIDKLVPKRFKYNDGRSGRFHTGFIAQEVKDAMEEAGLTEQEFATLCYDNIGQEGESWSLRYEELIAPMLAKIKVLETRLAALEGN